MIGLIIGAVALMGAAFGAAHHDGVFKKGYDTTYKDTVRFEYAAAVKSEHSSRAKADRLQAEMQTWGPSDEETAKNSSEPLHEAPPEPRI